MALLAGVGACSPDAGESIHGVGGGNSAQASASAVDDDGQVELPMEEQDRLLAACKDHLDTAAAFTHRQAEMVRSGSGAYVCGFHGGSEVGGWVSRFTAQVDGRFWQAFATDTDMPDRCMAEADDPQQPGPPRLVITDGKVFWRARPALCDFNEEG